MARLSELLKDAGWGNDASWFAPVVLAESGGNAKAKNAKSCGRRADGSTAHAIGLAQVCTIHLDKGGIAEGLTEDDLMDPITNLKVARKIYEAQGKGAWETITTGANQQYPSATALNKDIDTGGSLLSGATAALLPVPGIGPVLGAVDALGANVPSVGDVAGTIVDTPAAIAKALGTLTKQSTWFTVAKVTFGGALILVGTAGLVFVVAKNVSSATPIGKVLK